MEIIPPQTKFLGHLGIPLSVRLSVQFCHGKVQNSCPIHIFFFGGAFFPTKIAYMYDFRACHNFVPRSFEQVQGHWNEKYKFVSVLYLSY